MNLKKSIALLIAIIILSAISTASFSAKKSALQKIKAVPEVKNTYIAEIVKIGGNVNVPRGTIVESVTAIGGDIDIAGEILKDAISVGGSIILRQRAVVHGDATAIGGVIKKDKMSKIDGNIMEVNMPQQFSSLIIAGAQFSPIVVFVATAFANLLAFLGILGLGIVAGLYFPKRIGWASVAVEKKAWKSFWWGVLLTILAVPFAILLCLSVIGIPLILIEFLLYGLAIVLGYISFIQVIGKKLLSVFKRFNQPMLTEIIWGVVIMALIGLVPVIGALVNCIACTIGLGASWISRLGTGEA